MMEDKGAAVGQHQQQSGRIAGDGRGRPARLYLIGAEEENNKEKYTATIQCDSSIPCSEYKAGSQPPFNATVALLVPNTKQDHSHKWRILNDDRFVQVPLMAQHVRSGVDRCDVLRRHSSARW